VSTGARAQGEQPLVATSDGMRIEWDVPITIDDGLVLRADVFRPVAAGLYHRAAVFAAGTLARRRATRRSGAASLSSRRPCAEATSPPLGQSAQAGGSER
jgi:hypothetical protein